MSAQFTKPELHALSKALHRGMQGNFEREHYELVMLWAETTRLYSEQLELVLQGYLDISGVDEDGTPLFVATAKGLASAKRDELERLGV